MLTHALYSNNTLFIYSNALLVLVLYCIIRILQYIRVNYAISKFISCEAAIKKQTTQAHVQMQHAPLPLLQQVSLPARRPQQPQASASHVKNTTIAGTRNRIRLPIANLYSRGK